MPAYPLIHAATTRAHTLMACATMLAVASVIPAVTRVAAQPTPARGAESDSVILKEWTVPWGAASRPRDPALGADGRIWFVGQEGNYVAHLDPRTAKFTRVEIDAGTNERITVALRGPILAAGNQFLGICDRRAIRSRALA